ncbi:MAG: hypothetical protein A2514_07900 [Gammaproteobacteria bacterium RIFOXYD12_FULL_61_37]|nr:MAG: hypothetical protein A2514_07900 [Gammaproteobacteria bacterium RIFOXYD12_FULL_61_37]
MKTGGNSGLNKVAIRRGKIPAGEMPDGIFIPAAIVRFASFAPNRHDAKKRVGVPDGGADGDPILNNEAHHGSGGAASIKFTKPPREACVFLSEPFKLIPGEIH